MADATLMFGPYVAAAENAAVEVVAGTPAAFQLAVAFQLPVEVLPTQAEVAPNAVAPPAKTAARTNRQRGVNERRI